MERRDFGRWLTAVSPLWTWHWPYLEFIRKHLNNLMMPGSSKRLMLFLPPRHGKSELVTVRYPVWRMERDPTTRVIVGAYNQTLAEKFSRKSRAIARTRFPLNEERTAAEDWETLQGGGLRAVGVGGGITGQGGNLIIIDDPVKSREEAESQVYRDRVWDWYTDDLYTRLEPGGAMILIMTRWHQDDLAGRILASDDAANWKVVSLPAEAEEGDPLGRKPGEALCPERYDQGDLRRIRSVLGTYSYTALFQQRPQPREGGLFKRQWFEIVAAVPADVQRVRYWDKAATIDAGDFTAGVLVARAANGIYYIEDVKRGQWSPADRKAVQKQTAELDKQKGSVQIWVEQEPGSGGKESAILDVRDLAGYAVRVDRVTGDKASRADPFAAQCEAGNVKLVRGSWNAAYLDELTVFPNGTHDDQVDASSGAFNKLALGIGRKAKSWQG